MTARRSRAAATAAWNARHVVALLTLFAGYVSTALFGLHLNAVSGFAAPVWPPTGIAIAFVVLFGRRMWPAILLGAFLTNFLTGAAVPVALMIAVGNTLEALVASWIIERRGFRPELDRPRDVLDLAIFVALISTMVSPTVGVTALWLGGVVASPAFGSTWTAWWIGDALGAIVFAPLLFALARGGARQVHAKRIPEAVALVLALAVMNFAVFFDVFGFKLATIMVLPIILWTAVRFSTRATVFAVFVTAACAVWGTLLGSGPFVDSADLSRNLLLLQLAIACLAVTGYALSAFVRESERANRSLQTLNEQLEKRVEAQTSEIRKAKERSEAILENIGDGVLAIDRDAKIIVFNAAAERMLGVARADAVGHPYEKVFAMEEASGRPVSRRPMRISLTTGKGVVTTGNEHRYYVRADGTRFPSSITSMPVYLGKDPIGVVQVFRDVTEEEKIERAKTEFVELASHQLRMPLTAIRWNVDLIADNALADGSRCAENLGEIRAATARMAEVIDVLLNVSKIDLGVFPIRPTSVDLSHLAQDVIRELSTEIARKRLKVAVSASGKAESDRNLMRIVLQNLLSNAVKYTPDGGRVDVAAHVRDGLVRLSVADRGIGIPDAQKGEIFTKFFRTEAARLADPEGSGLGLYLSKAILGQIGGRIWFESNKPGGTVFHVEMPSVLQPKRRAHKPHS